MNTGQTLPGQTNTIEAYLINILKQDPSKILELYREIISEELKASKDEEITNVESRFMTIKQWCNKFSYFSEGGLRWLIFNNKDFEARVVRRVGKKIFLDVQAIDEWISEQH